MLYKLKETVETKEIGVKPINRLCIFLNPKIQLGVNIPLTNPTEK